MKIAIDISQIVYQGTGVDTYTRNLVRELLRLNSDGRHEYILFGANLRHKNLLDDYAKKLNSEGLKFNTSFWLLPPTFTSSIWNQIHHVRLERLIGNFDLLHSSDWVQPPTKAKKVTTIHDLIVYKYPDSSHGKTEIDIQDLNISPNIVEVQKKRLEWVQKECDSIIVDSLATKKDCQKILAIPSNKMSVIYLAAGNGVYDYKKLSSLEKQKMEGEVRKKYKLARPFILAVGTREPRKNLDRLRQAAAKIDNLDLIIAGKSGWGSEKLQPISNVKLLGYVPEQDIQPLFASALAYVHPSLYEGFGVTVLEAMTLGTPVITSNNSSLPEVGGNAAIYVNPYSVADIVGKIKKVLSFSHKERNAVIAKCLIQASKFTWEKTARQTLAVYESLKP